MAKHAIAGMSIAVFGSINCDVIAYLAHLPKPGETLHGTGYKIGLGGKGANQAVAARRLGSDVNFIAGPAATCSARPACVKLQPMTSHTDLIRRDAAAATGIAIINVAANGENTISLIGDANMRMDESDVARAASALVKGARIVAAARSAASPLRSPRRNMCGRAAALSFSIRRQRRPRSIQRTTLSRSIF